MVMVAMLGEVSSLFLLVASYIVGMLLRFLIHPMSPSLVSLLKLSSYVQLHLLIQVINDCSIDVISSAFEGQSAVNRQRMVYKAIWEELQERVHAVDQMTTRTPTEAGAAK